MHTGKQLTCVSKLVACLPVHFFSALRLKPSMGALTNMMSEKQCWLHQYMLCEEEIVTVVTCHKQMVIRYIGDD
jgi:hypothetical protein